MCCPQVKQRSTGTRAGSADAYYMSPSGDVFRCRAITCGRASLLIALALHAKPFPYAWKEPAGQPLAVV